MLDPFVDSRGSLVELWRTDELAMVEHIPMMGYQSTLKVSQSRGPHVHKYQTDLFIFTPGPKIHLRLWDDREISRTFQRHWFVDLEGQRYHQVLVPPGVVHGYMHADGAGGIATIFNFPDQLYKGVGKQQQIDETRYEDADHPVFNWDA